MSILVGLNIGNHYHNYQNRTKDRSDSMTEQEILDFYKQLEEYYGDALANFEHYPRIFAHQVKLYKYYRGML
jgi:hypothetical protein